MSIEKAREILGDLVSDMNDKELLEFISSCKRFCSLVWNHAEKEVE